MKTPLTRRQTSVLAFIQKYLRQNGFPPTIREVARRFQIASPRGAQKHLDALQAKGYLRRTPGRSRALELSHPEGLPARPLRMLPILGQVRAGLPNLAVQENIGTLAVDPAITQDPRAFILQVKGHSMVEAGILEGDYAVIRPQNVASNGQIVLALWGDEATLKRFIREKNHILLKPANRRFKTIRIPPRSPEFRILGKVVGIVRKI